MCKMPALVLWAPVLPLVLATLPLIFLLNPSGQPTGCAPFLTDSSFHSYCLLLTLHWCWCAFLRVCTGLTKFNGDKIVQITEALISEPGEIRRFIQQAVDHWPHLLAVHFTLYSAEGIYGQQILAFCASSYRQMHERIIERNCIASPPPLVVLRWLWEQHGGSTIRCLLLLNQASICHPRASVAVEEECSQVVDLLQQTWRVISAGGQCRVERYFQVTRGDISGQNVALKTVALSLGLPVVTAITHRPVQRCTLITAQ